MEFIRDNSLLIVIVIGIILIFVVKKARDKDAITDYSVSNLGEQFNKLHNGETWLMFNYNKITQPRKKEHILNSYFQGTEVSNTRGYKYIISELVSDEYYEIKYNADETVKSKTGPYIVYKVIPKTESPDTSINVHDNNAPVNISKGDGIAIQNIVDSTFSNIIEEYRDVMINHGILEEDINVFKNYSQNADIKKSFLSKYGLELAKITVEVAGVVKTLFDIFNN